MDCELEHALKSDARASAEALTGKSYRDDVDTQNLAIALHFENVIRRKQLLEAAGDTTFSMGVEDYLRVVQGAGFYEVLNIPFVCRRGTSEVFRVLFRDDGILLVFDTFEGQVNGGRFYYNIRAREDMWDVISSGSHHDGVWCGYHDCREAVLFHIRKLEERGDFLNPWIKRPYLWLLHFGDTKGEYDAQEITQRRIEMLPESVRACINA